MAAKLVEKIDGTTKSGKFREFGRTTMKLAFLAYVFFHVNMIGVA